MARHRFDPAALDREVLCIVEAGGALATYVIRNSLSLFAGRPYHMKGLETHHVLTACKRLERAGRIRRVPSVYAVMLVWQVVPAAEISA